jgi:Holliday junction resolvase RusA-like endonuclease
MTSPHLTLFVRGLPVPQGSMSGFVVNGRAIVTHKRSVALRAWRDAVGYEARKAMGERQLLLGAVRVDIEFRMTRPRAHYRANGALKPNAPKYHRSKPDKDKLERAVNDALTGVVFKDDAQVASGFVEKVYTEGVPGIQIACLELEP